MPRWRPSNAISTPAKEEALICEAAYNRLRAHYDAAVVRLREGKLAVLRNVVECPSVPNLRDEVASFLNSAKRSLQCVGDVFNQFYVPDGKKPMVINANFEFAITRLENSQPVNEKFIKYLRDVVPVTKHFVDLRNGLEHPTDNDSTVVEDFRLTPKGIAAPSWRRGSVVEECPLVDEMYAFVEFLIDFCENVFFFGLMDNVSINVPFGLVVEAIPSCEIDPECPVRYRIGLRQLPDTKCCAD